MATNKVNIKVPSLDSLNLEIKLDGNWEKLDQLASNLEPAILAGYNKGISQFGKRLLAIVKRSLTTGTPPPGSGVVWQPHAASTTSRHGEHPIYNLTGSYSRAISISSYKARVIIGIPLRAKNASHNSKLTLNQLAILLEYGGNRIPARPVWGPSLASVGGKKALRATLITNIRSSLLKATGIRPNQVR